MHRRLGSIRLLRTSVLIALALGCGESTGPGAPAPLTELPRSLTAAEQSIVNAGNTFTFSLLRRINSNSSDSSLFFSPLSVSMALGMTLNGAAGTTFDGMRQALEFGSTSQESINAGYKDLIALLRGLDPTTDFRIANSIWYRQDFPFEQSFLTTTHDFFDAEVQGLDFNAPASLTTINNWVSQATAGRIPTILNSINQQDVMFLINAIYFKAKWRRQFKTSDTRTETFHAAGGTSQQVPLMHQLDSLLYAETPDVQIAELRYGNDAFAMDIVLPAAGKSADAFVASLTNSSWDSLVAQLHVAKVDFAMPKLTLSYERRLNDDLKALGMTTAFIPGGADFTRMSVAGRDLYIAFVKHKAWVQINEEGTEAAAVTAVGIGVTSAPIIPIMTVNRPFVFVIRERLSGTILFVGKVQSIPG